MYEVAAYRKRPIVIYAMQYDGSVNSRQAIIEWSQSHGVEALYVDEIIDSFQVKTLEGNMEISPMDYVIRGIHGEFYPCKPDIFHASYEEV